MQRFEAPAGRRRHRWLDVVLGLSAVFISMMSLAVAIGQGRTEERMLAANLRQVEAETWPYLRVGLLTELKAPGRTQISFELSNHGNGPARVEAFDVLFDGHPVDSFPDLVRRCCAAAGEGARSFRSIENPAAGAVLAPHESLVVSEFDPTNAAARALMARVSAVSDRIGLRACYCSVFDQCWLATNRTPPRPVRTCAPPPPGGSKTPAPGVSRP